jgi:copper chaperone CopZ
MKRFLFLALFLIFSTSLAYAEQTQLTVTLPDLDNEPRADVLKRQVLYLPGVRAVAIDLANHQMLVTYDSSQIEETRIRQVISETQ